MPDASARQALAGDIEFSASRYMELLLAENCIAPRIPPA